MFNIPICTCINSVSKMLGNQIVFTPSIEVIPFSKYLRLFCLGVVLGHANWANLIHVLGKEVWRISVLYGVEAEQVQEPNAQVHASTKLPQLCSDFISL